MSQEVADKAAKTFEDFEAAGGPTSHIEHITDREEAVKVRLHIPVSPAYPLNVFFPQRSRIKSAVSVFAWDASTLYPWKLTAHIMRLNLAMGLNFQTWTPVTSISESTDKPGQWVVNTDGRGSITTPTVVHATNAYASAILPELKTFIRPTPHMSVTFMTERHFIDTDIFTVSILGATRSSHHAPGPALSPYKIRMAY